MAEADRRAIAAGTPVEVLMDRAGRAVAWAVRRRLGGTYGMRAVVACGKGNNGGDGIVAARVLRGWGVRVEVVRLGEGVADRAMSRMLARADVAMDAMYGTGFRGELEGDARVVAEAFSRFAGPVVAIDIPSGVDGLTGEVRGVAVRADETVCFAAVKPGLCFEPGRSLSGTVRLVDIGITVTDPDTQPRTFLTDADDVRAWLPARPPAAHKWMAGVFVVGGSGGMTGAALLASRAAMRAGAGIVWCGVPGSDAAARASGTEVITRALPATPDGALGATAGGEVLASVGRFRALAVGPGLGRAPETVAAVREAVGGAQVPVVVDADGLHALAGQHALLQARRWPTVLTPHEGEYAALHGAPPVPDRLAAARELAAATGAVVLLKGPGTVVADPGGRAAVCPLGGPWLASAGTGDVLTGIVAGFLARGMPAFEAAAAAARVHAESADLAGHTGLVAGDLVDAIPAVLDAVAC
jgi:NAD(P)H-hydrate epimerase